MDSSTNFNILFVTPFSFRVSGADESLLSVLPTLTEHGCQHHVLLPTNSPYAPKYAKVTRVHRFPLTRVKRTKNPFSIFFFLLCLPAEVFFILRLLRREKISLVHINMESSLGGALAAKVAGIPCIIHYRGKARTTPKWFFDIYLPLLTRLSQHIVAISRASAQGFFDRGLERHLTILYNPLSISSSPDLSRSFYDPWPELRTKKMILFVGRWDLQKRIQDIIDAAHLLLPKFPDLGFAIVGGDPNIPEERAHFAHLENYLKSLTPKPPVYFLGATDNVAHAMASSQILAMPAIDEGFGRVIIEAMHAKLPIIAARSGAFPEILQNETLGYLFEPQNPASLAEKITEVLVHTQRSQEKAELAHRFCMQTFMLDKYVTKLIEVYKELI